MNPKNITAIFLVWLLTAGMAVSLSLPGSATSSSVATFENCKPDDGSPKYWTKATHTGNQVKFYAKFPQVGEKIQFMVQHGNEDSYKEFAWARIEASHLDLNGRYSNVQNQGYFIRTLDLKPGKNRVRIVVDDEVVWGTKTYLIKPSWPAPELGLRQNLCDTLASPAQSPPPLSGGTSGESGSNLGTFALRGQVQKGPLIFGSQVWVSELDTNLEPTGRNFLTRTIDDLGRFNLSPNVTSSLVEITATGYYFDEIAGELSGSQISLNAITDLRVESAPTVNVLTTLQAPRLRQLMSEGQLYASAALQSQSEVLGAFGIDSEDVVGFNSLYSMNLEGNSDPDSVLLATTAILSQMATAAITRSSQSQASHMTYFLSQMGSDLSGDGQVNNSITLGQIRSASRNLNLQSIRNNVETYYSQRGLNVLTPVFEEWVDKDNSGVLPQRRVSIDWANLTNLSGVEAYDRVTSDVIRFTPLEAGLNVQVSATGATIYKNGVVVEGSFTTVNSADEIFLSTTSAGFGQTRKIRLLVGSGLIEWTIATKASSLIAVSPSGQTSCWSGHQNSSEMVYYAVPIAIPDTGLVRYAGVGLYGFGDYFDFGDSGVDVVSMSIHLNDSGQPGSQLANSSVIRYRGTGGESERFFTHEDVPCISYSPQAYLGPDGVSLVGGEVYWLVVEFSEPTTVSLQGIHSPSYLGFTYDDFNFGTNFVKKHSLNGNSWTEWASAGGGHMGQAYDLPGWFLGE
jgi:hypothetical protein